MISARLHSLAQQATHYSQRLTSFAEMMGPQRDLKLSLPSSLFAVTDCTLDIFAQRLTRYGHHFRRGVVAQFSEEQSIVSHGGRLSLPPSRSGGLGHVHFAGSMLSQPVQICVASPERATTRILCIGDSLSWQGTLSVLSARLQQSGIEPQFIGTYSDIGGVPCEARSSWQSANFTGQLGGVNSDGSGRTYPIDADHGDGRIGTSEAYLRLSVAPAVYGPRWAYNPFIRAATPHDDPTITRGGYVFDLVEYLDRFGFDAPNIVFIALGTNDVRNWARHVSTPQALDSLDIIHRQTRRALPHAKIAFVLNGFGNSMLWARMYPLVDAMLARYSGAEMQGTYVLPAYLAVDPKEGYRSTEVDARQHAAHPEFKVDDTHMGEIGRRQWADMLYAFVVNHLAKEAILTPEIV
jgi:lysophospholipase L1-like esterase